MILGIFFKLTQYACKFYIRTRNKKYFFFNNNIKEGRNVIYIFLYSFHECDEI